MYKDESKWIFYLDTAIWMDWFEDRIGYRGEPLGRFADDLLMVILSNEGRLAISEMVMEELERRYTNEEIMGMFFRFKGCLIKVVSSDAQRGESRLISRSRDIPYGDALHSVICRDYRFILVSRDRNFLKVRDVCESCKPEELI